MVGQSRGANTESILFKNRAIAKGNNGDDVDRGWETCEVDDGRFCCPFAKGGPGDGMNVFSRVYREWKT